MPPIPIHRDTPIAPIKPNVDGITPKTADADTPAPTRTVPAAVPATTTASSDGPPAPQPGARPVAPTEVSRPLPIDPDTKPPTDQTAASPYTPTPSDPVPPQPGATPTQHANQGYTATHTTTVTQLSAPPPQLSIPPPSDTQLAGRSTSTSTAASKPGPTTLNLGPAAPSPFQAQHTKGAVSGDTGNGGGGERTSLEHPPGYTQAPDHLPSGGGIQDTNTAGGDGGSVGGAAWNLLSKAGEALKKGEEAAWKAVRNN
ncbi:hypothetical protein K491DRAFT_754302 [Lophiostoma macrostomum CBS 122681]|uniref:Uncharacterized protein n=1 Tax=Lophiostoma macrostomum CBS 122681 TaxID=1314788 RepID=A0A6A6TL30_9PLEO|nr:hypothetical protein K491DRAFT_754302 [Lophiostoma macrostomum CBS 122681]